MSSGSETSFEHKELAFVLRALTYHFGHKKLAFVLCAQKLFCSSSQSPRLCCGLGHSLDHSPWEHLFVEEKEIMSGRSVPTQGPCGFALKTETLLPAQGSVVWKVPHRSCTYRHRITNRESHDSQNRGPGIARDSAARSKKTSRIAVK